MTLKNPVLLKTKGGDNFLDYWFFRTGEGEGYRECSGGESIVKINTINGRPDGIPISAYVFSPKTVMGLYGAVDDFKFSEGGVLHQVGLRDLASYVCDNDSYFNVNVRNLPDVLAGDWRL